MAFGLVVVPRNVSNKNLQNLRKWNKKNLFVNLQRRKRLKKKIINTSKKKEIVSKADLMLGHSGGDSDEGLDMVGFKLTTLGERAIMQIGRGMQDWLKKNPDELKLSTYFHELGISMRTVNRWCHRYPLFDEWFESAMDMMGNRREKLALYHEIDVSIVMRTMHLYDPAFKRGIEWMEAIKNLDTGNKQQIIIIDKYPSSDLVPPLKD